MFCVFYHSDGNISPGQVEQLAVRKASCSSGATPSASVPSIGEVPAEVFQGARLFLCPWSAMQLVSNYVHLLYLPPWAWQLDINFVKLAEDGWLIVIFQVVILQCTVPL